MGLWEILKGEAPGFWETLFNYENVGQFGEYSTEYALTNNNLDGNLRVFRNLYVPYNGKTTEVDLLMLHEKGIFVFESKNYSGWIFGSRDQLNWTQALPNGEKNRFYNPIRQNATHINALSKALKLPRNYFFSYIVFSERCELKKIPENTDDIVIVRRPLMLCQLRKQLNTLPEVYSLQVMDSIAKILEGFTSKSEEEKQAHIESVQAHMNSDVCPLCGGKLVKRSGKYGFFLGCSSYPRCHYTRNIG